MRRFRSTATTFGGWLRAHPLTFLLLAASIPAVGYAFRWAAELLGRSSTVELVVAASVLSLLILSMRGLRLAVQRLYQVPWSGLGPGLGEEGKPTSPKTLWDWFDLLVVPFVLAIVALGFTMFNAAWDRGIATERAREEALQTYLDRMEDLLLDNGLRTVPHDDSVRHVARARTLTVLRGLDARRKGDAVRFLYESGLIGTEGVEVVVRLSTADLRGTDLRGAGLRGADFSHADLRGAALSYADLSHVALRGADLTNANMRGVDLIGADLFDAHLIGADLSLYPNLRDAFLRDTSLFPARLSQFANLRDANLSGADLSGANLRGAKVSPADLSGANMSRAKFRDANLIGANLSRANLSYAVLHGAHLRNADLSGANLSHADLSGANLPQANLSGANLTGADLSDANLSYADLSRAVAVQDQLDETLWYYGARNLGNGLRPDTRPTPTPGWTR